MITLIKNLMWKNLIRPFFNTPYIPKCLMPLNFLKMFGRSSYLKNLSNY